MLGATSGLAINVGNRYSLHEFNSAAEVSSIAFDTLGVTANTNGIGLSLPHEALCDGSPLVQSVPQVRHVCAAAGQPDEVAAITRSQRSI